ncbi:hypothetical protein [Ralstonia insidiosa]|uniref:Uncharacterized protein n=1 Tax=Ralstonia insidiosa TaxID=190721 RepID=A0A848NTX8_9RALS|nr:hypothetical protein [Ralstonia insidiosa]NMV36799.1 hypothetical protein [Ralstonia insidiosa]
MPTRTPGRGRLKGLLIYIAAVTVVFGVHAYALHMDSVAAQKSAPAHADKSV